MRAGLAVRAQLPVALALAFVASAVIGGSGGAGEAPAGPVILTIGGAVGSPNRGALDKTRDGLLVQQNHAFDKARTFTREELAALPQHDITVKTEYGPDPVKLAGPRLADIAAAAGAEGKTLQFYAMDQYNIELTPAEQKAHDWVLGLSADGVPLAVGGRGPTWLAFDMPGATMPNDDEKAQLVWSVYYIEAK